MFQKVTQPVTAEKTILVLPEKTKTANQEESHNCNMACKTRRLGLPEEGLTIKRFSLLNEATRKSLQISVEIFTCHWPITELNVEDNLQQALVGGRIGKFKCQSKFISCYT